MKKTLLLILGLLTIGFISMVSAQWEYIQREDFDCPCWNTDSPPPGWEINFNSPMDCSDWHRETVYRRPPGGSGAWASLLRWCEPWVYQTDDLISPVMDCSEYAAVRLCIDKSWQRYGCCSHANEYTAQILGSDDGGKTWKYVVSNFGTCSWQNDQRYDITSWAARKSEVRIKFHAEGKPGNICWWNIDNFCVQGIPREVSNVAVISIDDPIGVLCVDHPYSPKATVINVGKEPEDFDVTMVITPLNYSGPSWVNTKHIDALAPCTPYQVVFNSWMSPGPQAGKTDSITVYITHNRDPNPSDDTVYTTLITWADVGITEDIWPSDTVYANSTYNPTLRIENFACGRTGDIPIFITIEKDTAGTSPIVYFESENASELLAGEDEVHTFLEPWTPKENDIGYTFTLTAWTGLEGDMNAGNDTIRWRVICTHYGSIDAQALSIDAPLDDSLVVGKAYDLKGTVKNVGTTPYISFDVFYIITHNGDEVYKDQRYVADLASDYTEQVSFGDWIPEEEGEYKLMLITAHKDDANPSNDTTYRTIFAKKATGIEISSDRRAGLEILYPNPMNSQIVISYQLPVASKVSLVVYDITGKLVKNLVNETKETGSCTAIWDAKDVPAGIYFVKLITPEYKATRKVILTR